MVVATLLAAAAAGQAAPPEQQRVAVERFVAACVHGELTSANLRPIAASALPAAVRAEFRRRPPGRYYRFQEASPSYLIVINDARAGARYHTICALAAPIRGPWSLFSAVMHALRPESRTASARPEHLPRRARTMSASMTNFEQGYSIGATRAGRYTLIESLQFTPKGVASDGGAPTQ